MTPVPAAAAESTRNAAEESSRYKSALKSAEDDSEEHSGEYSVIFNAKGRGGLSAR